jgi:multidrug efflux pump subunit AcrA (membrane-fusion protein)
MKRYAFVSAEALIVSICAVSQTLAQGRPPTAVDVMPVVERQTPATVRLVGTVMPRRESVVASEVEGPIQALDIEEGQPVSAGDVICQVDRTVHQLMVDEARGRLDALKAKLDELINGTRPEEIKRLKAAVDEADAMEKKWSFERDRVRGLQERNASSEKELHDTEMEYIAAQQRLAKARAELEEAVNGPRAETIAQARADVVAQEATVRLLERDLAKTKITAPFTGFVVKKRTEVGEWISEGGPVCEMVELDRVKVRIDVPERAIRFATVGAETSLQIEALDMSRSAKISRVVPLGQSAARTFPIEIDLDNSDRSILPGMFVWAQVPADKPGPRLWIPKDAIVPKGVDKTIFVVHEQPEGPAMAMPMPVTTGLEKGDEVAVSAPGLKAGDLVVCRANERLFGPTPVTPRRMNQGDESSASPGRSQAPTKEDNSR